MTARYSFLFLSIYISGSYVAVTQSSCRLCEWKPDVQKQAELVHLALAVLNRVQDLCIWTLPTTAREDIPFKPRGKRLMTSFHSILEQKKTQDYLEFKAWFASILDKKGVLCCFRKDMKQCNPAMTAPWQGPTCRGLWGALQREPYFFMKLIGQTTTNKNKPAKENTRTPVGPAEMCAGCWRHCMRNYYRSG